MAVEERTSSMVFLSARVARWWACVVLMGVALGALALLWAIRDLPLQPLPYVRLDGLSAFFIFATLAGLALYVAVLPAPVRPAFHAIALASVAILAYSTTQFPVIILAYLALAALELVGPAERRLSGSSAPANGPEEPSVAAVRREDAPPARWARLHSLFRAARSMRVERWPAALAAGCLLLGYGALTLNGALRYDERLAGAALNSFSFWFVLLAALVPWALPGLMQRDTPVTLVMRIAWIYPLVRLYSLGPWNTGWSVAALLLGGAAALWASASAFAAPQADVRGPRVVMSYAALAIAAFGIGTSAGIAAGCYSLLVAMVLAVGLHKHTANARSSLSWLLSGAIPFTAPFVAVWMVIGAATAGNAVALAGVAWLVILLNALAIALYPPEHSAEHGPRAPALLGFVLGVGAPLALIGLVEPAIRHLQGGLTVYGDVNIWPWIGLATRNSAHAQVTVMPSVAIASLMLVLTALVYLIARLRESVFPAPASDAAERASVDAPPLSLGALLALLRQEVPWLSGASPHTIDSERRVDDQ